MYGFAKRGTRFHLTSSCFCDMFGFFFSSRRRHTRCLSDWSSDVCSSDLPCPDGCHNGARAEALPKLDSVCRSEERRVGKECRSGRLPELHKQNNPCWKCMPTK